MHLQSFIANTFGRLLPDRNRRGRAGTRVVASISRAENLESRAMLSGVSAALSAWSHLLHQQSELHGNPTDGISNLIRNSVPARYQSQLNDLLTCAELSQPLPAWHTAVTERIDSVIDAAVPSKYRSAVHIAVDALVEGFHDNFVAEIPAPVVNVVHRPSASSTEVPVSANIAPPVILQSATQTSVPAWHNPLTDVSDNVASSISEDDGSDSQQFVDDKVSPTAIESESLPAWHNAITETISDVIDRLPSQYREQAEQVVDDFVTRYYEKLVEAVDRLPAGLLDDVFSCIGHRRGWLDLFA